MSLPQFSSILPSQDVDEKEFFEDFSRLNTTDRSDVEAFLDKHGGTRLRVAKLSDSMMITKRANDCPIFEDFSIDLWKEYYIQEDVIQLAILNDKSPVEGLFLGLTSGKVYVCVQADDFSQQKVTCVAPDLYSFVWNGPSTPIEYKSSTCLFDGCYGCFDPVIRDRVLRFKI